MKHNYWFYERGAGDADPRPLTLKMLMSPHVRALAPEQLVRDALHLVQAEAIHHIPIVEADGRLVGLVTATDLLQKVLHGNSLNDQERYHATLDTMLPLRQIMTQAVHTLGSHEPVAKAVALFLKHKIRCVPVVDSGKLQGIVTETDMLRLMQHMVE